MSIFNYIKRKLAASDQGPDIKFGRHTYNSKEQEEIALLSEAIHLFKEDQLLDSLEYLLNYLRNDLEDNLAYDVENGELFFELYQGSKQIIGRCNAQKFVAISHIATIEKPHIGLYRKLLERNYLLKYSRFCIEGNQLILKFDSFTVDASPQKIFYALKEVAINADKYDDLLADEFEELENNLSGKIQTLDAYIQDTKEEFLRSEILKTNEYITEYASFSDNPDAIEAYVLLYCNYKLDYLLKPEGFMMEIFERNHRIYFENSKKSSVQKNKEIQENFSLITKRTSEQLKEEFYQSCHTFNYTKAASHYDLKALIEKELPKAISYTSLGQPKIALHVYGYIAAYSLFHYNLPTPDLDLLHLLIRVLENDYFLKLGFTPSYQEEGKAIQAIVEKRIESIIENNKPSHPYFKPNYHTLNYENIGSFCQSLLRMIASYDIHYQKQFV